MKFNGCMVNGKWLEVRAEIQKNWRALTDAELDKRKGDIKAISGLIKRRYGLSKENYNEKVSKIFSQYE